VDDAKRRAQFTYDAAAEFFADAALGFWDRFGLLALGRIKAERPASHSADSLSAVRGCVGLRGECGPLGGGTGHRRSRSIRGGTR
jgi:hypothetical protein